MSTLTSREVWHIAKSVTKWVWARDAKAEAAFVARQAFKGRRGGQVSGEARRAATEDQRANAWQMRARDMTQAAIANELKVHVNTVANWLRLSTHNEA